MSAPDIFKAFYRTVQPVIAPTLRYSQTLYEAELASYSRVGKDWLDLGCGHQLLPPWRHEQEKHLASQARILIGLDYDFDALRKHRTIVDRVRGDVSRLPFKDDTFDLISSNMVFEHLKRPEAELSEIFRTLRPGGILIFHTPNKYGYGVLGGRLIPRSIKVWLAWLLQGRREEDVYPTFYRVNSASVIRQLAAGVGFQVEKIRLIVSTPNFAMVPPLMIPELLLLRLLMTRSMRSLRTNIIGVLKKPIRGRLT